MERLTEARAKTIKPRSNRFDVQDHEVPTLFLRVYPSGRKTWSLRYSIDGIQTRESLGVFLESRGKTVIVSPGAARTEARAFLTRIGTRGSVAKEKALIENMPRLAAWFEKFLEINPRDWTPGTSSDMKGRFRLYIGPVLGKTRLNKITEADLESLGKRIKEGDNLPLVEGKRGKGGARTADKSVELILTLLKWADKPHNLFPQVWRLPEYSRQYIGTEKEENYIYPHEAGNFFDAVEKLRSKKGYRKMEADLAADIILLALFTGARKANVLSAEWLEFDFTANVWRIPRAKFKSRKKTNKGCIIPLIPQAVALLTEIKRIQELKRIPTPFVFPNYRKPEKHTGEVDKSWDFVRETAKLQRVNFHGLRHTIATWQGQSGVNQKLIAASLGQADPTSANSYVHSDIEVVRVNMANVIDAVYTVIDDDKEDQEMVSAQFTQNDWCEMIKALEGSKWATQMGKQIATARLNE